MTRGFAGPYLSEIWRALKIFQNCLIFKNSTHFQKNYQFSKNLPIFKMLTHFQNVDAAVLFLVGTVLVAVLVGGAFIMNLASKWNENEDLVTSSTVTMTVWGWSSLNDHAVLCFQCLRSFCICILYFVFCILYFFILYFLFLYFVFWILYFVFCIAFSTYLSPLTHVPTLNSCKFGTSLSWFCFQKIQLSSVVRGVIWCGLQRRLTSNGFQNCPTLGLSPFVIYYHFNEQMTED